MSRREYNAFVTELTEFDVLMGRGSPSADYSGNLHFRELVKQRREDYMNCARREEKHRIAKEVIATVHQRGGRFLEKINTMEEAEKLKVPLKTQAWKVIPASSALYIKVKQLMRDVGAETQTKRKLRREAYRQLRREEQETKRPWKNGTEQSSNPCRLVGTEKTISASGTSSDVQSFGGPVSLREQAVRTSNVSEASATPQLTMRQNHSLEGSVRLLDSLPQNRQVQQQLSSLILANRGGISSQSLGTAPMILQQFSTSSQPGLSRRPGSTREFSQQLFSILQQPRLSGNVLPTRQLSPEQIAALLNLGPLQGTPSNIPLELLSLILNGTMQR